MISFFKKYKKVIEKYKKVIEIFSTIIIVSIVIFVPTEKLSIEIKTSLFAIPQILIAFFQNEKQEEFFTMQIEEKKKQEKIEKEEKLKEKRRNYVIDYLCKIFDKYESQESVKIVIKKIEYLHGSNYFGFDTRGEDDLKDLDKNEKFMFKVFSIELSDGYLYKRILYDIPNGDRTKSYELKEGYANFYNDLINDYDKQKVDRQLAEILKDEKIDI